MLAVILSILKWIGIVILVILGILFLVLGLVLFVPIRYKVDGFYKDNYQVHGKINWLLHIVSFTFDYDKEQPFHMKLRILGISIFDNLKKKENRKKSKETVIEHAVPEIVASSVQEDNDTRKIQAEDKNDERKEDNKHKDNKIAEVELIKEEKNPEEESPDKVDKLNFMEKVKLIWSKAIGIFRNIKYTIHKIYGTIKDIIDNITYYIELFKNDSTKAALVACKKQLIRIFKNLKPQKFQLNLHVGMDDPATMGDILGVWGMLYPIHQGHIDICPDFEQAILEGEFYCKGRVTVYIYIWTVMIILFDKDIRRLRKCLVRKGK